MNVVVKISMILFFIHVISSYYFRQRVNWVTSRVFFTIKWGKNLHINCLGFSLFCFNVIQVAKEVLSSKLPLLPEIQIFFLRVARLGEDSEDMSGGRSNFQKS